MESGLQENCTIRLFEQTEGGFDSQPLPTLHEEIKEGTFRFHKELFDLFPALF